MLFYFTTLNLARFLIEDALGVPERSVDFETFSANQAWIHSDFLCCNYILNVYMIRYIRFIVLLR